MLIGLNGFKGVGKDTAGAYLVENYGFTRLSFAEPLKRSAAALFDIEPEVWDRLKNDDTSFVILGYYNVDSEYPGGGELSRVSARKFLQRYGTEAHRDVFGQDFWIDQCLDHLATSYGHYVVTDARFENELHAIRYKRGVNIRIIRPEVEGEDHPSEVEPPEELIDFFIDNSGSFENLYEQLDGAMVWYGIERRTEKTY